MDTHPSSHEDVRKWLTRHEMLASLSRLYRCRQGHPQCSTRNGGPCHTEVLNRCTATATDRALELVACGAGRGLIWRTLTRDFPVLELPVLEDIIEEAFSLGFATPEH
ncbi:MAG: hypothetical protein JSV86_10095 [Gemmatimonadota bacterium]|nr:MAG: hypothetical protein JSV86_10095 [Gemmatimonadota bacterium]